MIKQNQRVINFLNIASDAVLIFCSFYLALYVRFEFLHGHTSLELFSARYLLIVAGYSLLVVLIYAALRMYGSYRFKESGSEIATILLVNAVAVLGFMAFLYVTRVMEFPRLAVFLFWLLSSAAVIGKRMVGRGILRYYRKLGYNQKHVLLVGSGPLAGQYLADIAAGPHLGITVDGYLRAEPAPADKPVNAARSRAVSAALADPAVPAAAAASAAPPAAAGPSIIAPSPTVLSDPSDPFLAQYACPCLGSYAGLETVLGRQAFDEVIVALEPTETAQIKPVIAAIEKEGVRVSLLPFYSDYIPSHPAINAVGRSKLIDLRSTPLDNLGWALCKRGMDIAGSLLLIILTSPIMLITAIGVKLSSPGPILFKQERIGKDRKPFRMLKFRSMRVTGTEQTGWSTDADPRKTRFGSFIRKCSIDEIPQFFNVFKGDMSLVGPRPEVPYHVRHFKEEIPLYLVRQQVRPGITGWAQVHGLRGNTSIEERVKYDIWYIENWSLWLDIRILFKTAFGGMVNSEKLAGTKQTPGGAAHG